MAEIRCPMCSKPNPEDAETCTFCGARLKPLVVDTPGEPLATGGPQDAGGEEPVPDWLARIRSKAEADRLDDDEHDLSEPTSDEGGSPDWLGRLRQAEPLQEEGPPAGHIPDWLDEVTEEAESPLESEASVGPQSSGSSPSPDRPETGWLDRLRAESSHEEASEEEDLDAQAPPEPELFEPGTSDALDWLGELEETGSENSEAGSAAEGVSPWANFETPPETDATLGAGADELIETPDDWLGNLEGGEGEVCRIGSPSSPSPEMSRQMKPNPA